MTGAAAEATEKTNGRGNATIRPCRGSRSYMPPSNCVFTSRASSGVRAPNNTCFIWLMIALPVGSAS